MYYTSEYVGGFRWSTRMVVSKAIHGRDNNITLSVNLHVLFPVYIFRVSLYLKG